MSIRARLRADLVSALRAGHRSEVSTIRTLIAAIENAESIETEPAADPKIGLDHDQPRRLLQGDDISHILERERTEVAQAAAHYRDLGLSEEAGELEARMQVIERYLGQSP